jgi:DNA helicase-4
MRCDVHGRIADGIRAASAVGNTVGCFTDGHGRAVLAACSWLEVNGQWQKRLAADRSVDFEDMLVQAAGHLEAGTVDAGFDLIMVDEFQDASRARARLVRGLVQSPGRFLMAVGDDWQSINRFAGADLSVMTDFEALFGRGRQLALTTTFRCPQTVCDVARVFVSANPGQYSKPMRSANPDPGPPSPSSRRLTRPARWPASSGTCPSPSPPAASRQAGTAPSASTSWDATGSNATSCPGTRRPTCTSRSAPCTAPRASKPTTS